MESSRESEAMICVAEQAEASTMIECSADRLIGHRSKRNAISEHRRETSVDGGAHAATLSAAILSGRGMVSIATWERHRWQPAAVGQSSCGQRKDTLWLRQKTCYWADLASGIVAPYDPHPPGPPAHPCPAQLPPSPHPPRPPTKIN